MKFKLHLQLLWLLLVAVSTAFGQENEISLYDRSANVATVSELSRLKGKVRFSKQSTDTLNLGLVQTNWLVSKGGKKDAGKTILVTLSDADMIIYRAFFREELAGDLSNCTTDCFTYKTQHVKVDSLRLNKIQEKAQEENLVINFNHIEPFRSTFGYRCFGDASMPGEGRQMLTLVDERELDQLTDWLFSINPVKQLYGYLGLRLLQERESIHLTLDTEKKMGELEKSSKSICTCFGCTFWQHQTIRSQLTDHDVAEFIKQNAREARQENDKR